MSADNPQKWDPKADPKFWGVAALALLGWFGLYKLVKAKT